MKFSPSDVRVAGVVVTLWSIAVVILVSAFGLSNNKFFRFGPGESVHFFGNPVDDWLKYSGIVFYVAVQQLVQTYGLNTITPWLLTQVQNRRVKTLEESNGVVMAITIMWYFYLWTSRIISIQILLSQIDFLLLILLVDEIMTIIATKFFYLNHKLPRESLLDSIQTHFGINGANTNGGNDYNTNNGDEESGSPWARSAVPAPRVYAPSTTYGGGGNSGYDDNY